ncbi:hypothetical protein MC885_004480 [Smutsia gigantea]|nr:hypothetical protein MC885_004480 [Smutsia gigantea]
MQLFPGHAVPHGHQEIPGVERTPEEPGGALFRKGCWGLREHSGLAGNAGPCPRRQKEAGECPQPQLRFRVFKTQFGNKKFASYLGEITGFGNGETRRRHTSTCSEDVSLETSAEIIRSPYDTGASLTEQMLELEVGDVGEEQLLENIKRKVTSVSTLKNKDIKIRQDSITKLLTDVQLMKGKQESMDSKLLAMKHENEALWREVASLRQKHAQQQKVVNKLIQLLISLVQSNRILGVKRKTPLMFNDSSSAHSMPKYSRQYPLEHIHSSVPYSAPSPAYGGSSLYSPDAVANSGPIISDITELAPSSPLASPGGVLDERPLSSSPLV